MRAHSFVSNNKMVNGFAHHDEDDCDETRISSPSPAYSPSSTCAKAIGASWAPRAVDEFTASKMASRQLPESVPCNRQIVIITVLRLLLLLQPQLALILLAATLHTFTTVSNKSWTWNDPFLHNVSICFPLQLVVVVLMSVMKMLLKPRILSGPISTLLKSSSSSIRKLFVPYPTTGK